MENKILLPKNYLSWSCWRSSPGRFRREYFECGHKLDTRYLRFGKGIAELIVWSNKKIAISRYVKCEYERVRTDMWC